MRPGQRPVKDTWEVYRVRFDQVLKMAREVRKLLVEEGENPLTDAAERGALASQCRDTSRVLLALAEVLEVLP